MGSIILFLSESAVQNRPVPLTHKGHLPEPFGYPAGLLDLRTLQWVPRYVPGAATLRILALFTPILQTRKGPQQTEIGDEFIGLQLTCFHREKQAWSTHRSVLLCPSLLEVFNFFEFSYLVIFN